ncbi:MAG: pyridoxamine 5'-phosphate oxidase family protein, partial [Oscillospiraceae bacterium]|nr:pyridoxamine 5'-phosphate oxidase family protein [Oscillospiraceae bacterium]
MRRKDRERDAAFAWEVFDKAPFGVLSLRDGEGGYGVPISPARIGETVYFHCARTGKKLDCIA